MDNTDPNADVETSWTFLTDPVQSDRPANFSTVAAADSRFIGTV